ncbi:hypothetical protein [Fodinibius salsisoli]|uniref:Repeat domain-containing protein n=1 Tax=Fodinibius salsisoli TaxID=2820877 RepID=A0ABT3PRX3_9BACT|nr:hypothetical protein [Fodinibius salsisoli]MCW9708586.1 hypothetical protein [Fodinibius salsisoli]
MNNLKYPVLLLLAFITISCSSNNNAPWSQAIPAEAPFVIIPAEGATLHSVLGSSYTPFLDDITSSAIQLLSEVDSTSSSAVNIKSLILYPGTNNKLDIVWITEAANGYIDKLENKYDKEFAQNQYFFKEHTIQKLHLKDRTLFASALNDLTLLSESSLGIEEAIRAYEGDVPRADISDITLQPGHILMNTPALDHGIRQLAKVTYHPQLKKALQGTKPSLLSLIQEGEDQKQTYQFSGTISLDDSPKSNLVDIISGQNAPLTLDQYVSSNAAAFGFFRQSPATSLPDSFSHADTSSADSLFINEESRFAEIAQHLDRSFALVMYAESGFLTNGEHLFIRKLSDVDGFKKELDRLVPQNYAERINGTYFIQSQSLAQLIGSSLCDFPGFYLTITDDVAIISKRRELAEVVVDDKNRRRTIFYERQFRDIKETLPDELSSLFFINDDFDLFLEPYYYPNSYLNVLLSKFDLLTVATTLNDDQSALEFHAQTYRADEQQDPYEEKWHFPIETDLAGQPVLADIGGSSRQEVIFTSQTGTVQVLASDGTSVLEMNTGGDNPIGSPVVYDWYGTDQNVILQAAGNKIYGWNGEGEPLSNFPFVLDETVTAPLAISDIDGDGRPEALVATANRRLHALSERGQNVSGWPVTTNTSVITKPTVGEFRRTKTVLTFSGNAVHAWRPDGTSQANFPMFVNAPLKGSPTLYNDNILANAADGNLYTLGTEKPFADSLDVLSASGNAYQQGLYVSNSSLVGSPVVENMRVQSDGKTFDESMIITMDTNGSFFVFNTTGKLLLNKNMSQPADPSFSPAITDIDRDDQQDIITLANYGRLYIWNGINGNRMHIVPSTGMKYPIFSDIDEDGYIELIAKTDEGIQCWTIFGE